jgi:hypothetical protein
MTLQEIIPAGSQNVPNDVTVFRVERRKRLRLFCLNDFLGTSKIRGFNFCANKNPNSGELGFLLIFSWPVIYNQASQHLVTRRSLLF